MRNRFLTIPFLMLLSPSLTLAQDEPALKVDTKASEAQKWQTVLRTDSNESTAPAGIPKMTSVFANPEPVEVAVWDGGKLTNIEVSATLATRSPATMKPITPQQLLQLDRKQQANVVKHLAWEKVLLEKAKKAGIGPETPEVAKAMAAHEETLLNRLYYTGTIMPALESLTKETAKDYYNKNKDSLFTQPAERVIRALHVSTDELVTAEEGDTLKDLAKRISGDPEAAGNIIEANSPYYLRDVPAEMQDKVLSSPLSAGETLLVPKDKEAVTSATQLAEKIRGELAAGNGLDEIISSTNSNDFAVSASEPIRITRAAGYYEEILQAAANLKETSISEVIRTPRGLDILVLENEVTTQVLPFEQVQDELVNRVSTDENQQRETIEKTRKTILDRLWKKFNVEVNRDVVSRKTVGGPDALSTDTVIAKTGDFVYNLEQYLSDLRMTGKDWGQLSFDERMEVVKVAPRLTNFLIAKEAKDMGLDKKPEFKEAFEGLTESQIVAAYRKKQADPEDRHVTEAELRSYYNDHIDKYTSPAQVTVREISKRINMAVSPSVKAEAIEKAKQSLAEIRSRITTEEEFSQLARRESEAISTRSRGGLIGTVSETFRGEAFKNQLRQLQPGQISEPFLYGSEVMIIRLDSRTAPTAQPFESVRRRVMLDYAATEPRSMEEQQMDAALKEANFQLKM